MIDTILNSNEFIITLKVLLALFCGGILGIEREQKQRPAGFRTHMLVCVSAALVMITNYFIVDKFSLADPTRMGAQVISGIGFLGVGTIIVTGENKVKGLTTAAGLWATACVGLAIGAGNYFAAIIVCVLVYITMGFLHSLDRVVNSNAKSMRVYIEFEDVSDVGNLIRMIRKENIKIIEIDLRNTKKNIDISTAAFLSVSFPKKTNHVEMIELISCMQGIIYVEEI